MRKERSFSRCRPRMPWSSTFTTLRSSDAAPRSVSCRLAAARVPAKTLPESKTVVELGQVVWAI
jgi:hypothetical protein